MASGRPDYTSQSLIKGSDAGTHRTVAVDPAGNLLTLIKGQFGGAPVTIAVDAGGNILGILQGDYAGSLKTLAVDDKGRMLAVLTDPEDVFGNPHYMGSAELAARLGSPSCLERSGQVLFMDPGGVSLEQYNITLSGGINCSAELSGLYGQMGPLSYRLSAGPGVGESVTLWKKLPVMTEAKYGLEAVFGPAPEAQYLVLGLRIQSWAAIKLGIVRYDVVGQKLEYWNNAGAFVDVPGGGLVLTPYANEPHEMKLVVDPTSGKYQSLRVDFKTWDLSALAMQTPLATGGQYLQFQIAVTNTIAGTAINYLSNIVVTVNEA